jgi:hypothetical protein
MNIGLVIVAASSFTRFWRAVTLSGCSAATLFFSDGSSGIL